MNVCVCMCAVCVCVCVCVFMCFNSAPFPSLRGELLPLEIAGDKLKAIVTDFDKRHSGSKYYVSV